MARFFILLLVLWLSVLPAHAATIAVTSDKSIYHTSDTFTITITGDAQGASAYGVYGVLTYSRVLTNTAGVQQGVLTTGGQPWIEGATPYPDGFATVWNQIAGLTPLVPDGPVTSTVTLYATESGRLDFTWETEPVYAIDELTGRIKQVGTRPTLDFFGAEANGLSITICCEAPPTDSPPTSVPEPSAALIFSVGLFAAAIAKQTVLHAV